MTRQHPPIHIAIIMDGNGRWAQRQGQERLYGHKKGAETVRRITTHARKSGIGALTLYAFSAQNWNRPQIEVTGLMELLGEYIVSERAEILDNNIRFTTIGDLSRLSPGLQAAIADLKDASSGNDGMEFCIALSYGGQEEILRGVQRCSEAVSRGEISLSDITTDYFSQQLYTAHLPPVDLIVRTSGEQRISNFLLWQLAYAELYFTPTLWPDFTEAHFDEAVLAFTQRSRRFGLTGDQIDK